MNYPRLARQSVILALFIGFTGTAAQCQADARTARSDSAVRGPALTPKAAAAQLRMVAFEPPTASADEQRRTLRTAAEIAWDYVERNYSSHSGLVHAVNTWSYSTIWDIASALAAYHSAKGLGLISDEQYRNRMNRALNTLESAALYENVAFNKLYGTRDGVMVGRDEKADTRGYGWSALDMGRFLVWMKIVAENDPAARDQIQRIVQRLDLRRLVKDGYLRGGNLDLSEGTHKEYQEGRIGYEQYAAHGFALWGARAEQALGFDTNATPVDVLGFTILDDRRGGANLTSEPFIMMGLELGWPSERWEEQARNVLAAQRERFKRTRIMTMVSEDAVPVRPAYFYYYLLRRDGKDFVVRAAGGGVSDSYPRWVSAKAAFGWHALFPSDYTWSAVQVVQPAGVRGKGWSAGVYERSKRPTPGFILNTAAMVLEAAYFAQRNCPLVKPSCN